ALAVFMGELDKKEINSFLQSSFAKWNSKAAFAPVEQKHFDVKGTTQAINTPDKTNAMLLGVINIPISEKHPDYPAMYMANELLGGGAFLSSRIPQRLRENEGMSYGAGSFMNANYNYDAANWGVYAFFNPLYKGRLDSALHQEIDKARATGFTKDELQKSVTSWLEQNRTSLGENSFLANQIRTYLRDGRSLDDFTVLENKIQALNLEAVNAALRKYFDKQKLIMVYGGDFEKGKTPKKEF
ncbi:MAG: insulinase family protein, partial [Bacteroidota bacterium]